MSISFQSLLPKEMAPNNFSASSLLASQSHGLTAFNDIPVSETAMILPRRPVPEFLFQLTQMLSDPSNHQLIEWSGRRVIVHDPIKLEKEILQKYFRHSKYSSFQRQMNYFGFRKNAGKGRMSPCTYENDSVSDELSSLLFIKRKTQGAASSSSKKNVKAMKVKQEPASGAHSVSDDESHETPKVPLPLHAPDICTSHAMPKIEAIDNVPLVVTAEEYGAPGTIQLSAATAPAATPPPFLISNALVKPPSFVVSSPPINQGFSPAPVGLDTVISMGACALTQPVVISALPEPTAEQIFAHHQHGVPNPLLGCSHQSMPCPLLPATAAVEAKSSNNPQEGNDFDLSSQFAPDLTLGFLPPTHQQREECNDSACLISPLPSSDTIFPSPPKSPSLVSEDGDGYYGQQNSEISLSPSSSLVDLAMLPIMPFA